MRIFLNRNLYLAIVCALVATTLVTSGCSSKKKGAFGSGSQELGAAGGAGGAGIGEEGIGGSQSSIQQFEQSGVVHGGGPYRDVQFDYDSYRIDERGLDAVKENASLLQADPTRRVEIEGHCDDRGTSEYNLALGAKRARAVKDALVGMGIGGDRLDTVSYGEELPLCRDETDSCWATNRRAHLVQR
jgi:peptidoglycan-associated lipoprotein